MQIIRKKCTSKYNMNFILSCKKYSLFAGLTSSILVQALI